MRVTPAGPALSSDGSVSSGIRITVIVGALSFAGTIVKLVVQQRQVSEPGAAASTLTRGEAISSANIPPAAGAGFSSAAPTALATRVDEDRRRRWKTSLAEGRRASLEELAKKVHLSSVQVELLYDLLGTESETMLEVFRRVREKGLPMAEVGAQVELIRMATDKKVDAELDDNQFSGYEEMRPVYRVGL